MNPTAPDRRRFLKSAGLAARASVLGFPAITRCQSPNSKLGVALIGVGGRGGSHVKATVDAKEDSIALVDVNENHLGGALGQAPKARSHRDFRELFGGRLDDIDAVFVSTTEHTHAFATLPPSAPENTSTARSRSPATSSRRARSSRQPRHGPN